MKAALGLTLNEAENAFAKAIADDDRLDAHRHPAGDGREAAGHPQERPARVLPGGPRPRQRWAGCRTSRTGCTDALAAFTAEAHAFGLPEPRGLLLLGVQGCGKSLTAKAIASQWALPLLRLDIGRVFGGLVGSCEENLRRAIRVAESAAPAVLWIDEIDKALSGSASSNVSDGGTTARVLGTFLTWLQEKTAPVFVVATANRVEGLPPELLRKGRFDEIFFIDLPDAAERAEILRIHLRRRGREPERFDVAAVAAQAEQFSGAELEQVDRRGPALRLRRRRRAGRRPPDPGGAGDGAAGGHPAGGDRPHPRLGRPTGPGPPRSARAGTLEVPRPVPAAGAGPRSNRPKAPGPSRNDSPPWRSAHRCPRSVPLRADGSRRHAAGAAARARPRPGSRSALHPLHGLRTRCAAGHATAAAAERGSTRPEVAEFNAQPLGGPSGPPAGGARRRASRRSARTWSRRSDVNDAAPRAGRAAGEGGRRARAPVRGAGGAAVGDARLGRAAGVVPDPGPPPRRDPLALLVLGALSWWWWRRRSPRVIDRRGVCSARAAATSGQARRQPCAMCAGSPLAPLARQADNLLRCWGFSSGRTGRRPSARERACGWCRVLIPAKGDQALFLAGAFLDLDLRAGSAPGAARDSTRFASACCPTARTIGRRAASGPW